MNEAEVFYLFFIIYFLGMYFETNYVSACIIYVVHVSSVSVVERTNTTFIDSRWL